MKNQELGSKIVTLLDDTASLRRDWQQSPQVTHIPFMGTRERFFILVNLHVRPDATTREKLINGSIAVAKLIIGSGLLTDEKGVEVSAFVTVPEQKNLKRVFRLSILDTAFSQAAQIEAADLLDKVHMGISCQWPLQRPE